MTRYFYGGGGDAVIVSTAGTPLVGATANVYNAQTGGTLVTDLLNAAGSPITQAVSDSQGQFLFQGPDSYVSTLYLDFGSGDRWALKPRDQDQAVSAKLKLGADVGGTSNSYGWTLKPSDINTRALTLQALTGQNVSVLRVQNSSGVDVFKVSGASGATGNVAVTPDAVGADSLLVNSPTGLTAKIIRGQVNGTDKITVDASGNLVAAGSVTATGALAGSNITTTRWTAYTPTWTATTTNPTLGNGTLNGEYALVGKTCYVRIFLKLGSTTALGSGTYQWSLPFAAAAQIADPLERYLGSGFFSRGSWHMGVTYVAAGTSVLTAVDTSAGTLWSNSNPASQVSGDYVGLSITYQIA